MPPYPFRIMAADQKGRTAAAFITGVSCPVLAPPCPARGPEAGALRVFQFSWFGWVILIFTPAQEEEKGVPNISKPPSHGSSGPIQFRIYTHWSSRISPSIQSWMISFIAFLLIPGW